MRLVISILLLVGLMACVPTVLNDGAEDVNRKAPAEEVLTEEAAVAEGETEEDGTEVAVVIENNNPTISDTQDFGAVTERLSIEDDKAILKAQRDKFKVIEPTALPSRVKTANVVEYALTSTNPLGVKAYSRPNPFGKSITKRACQQFSLPDDAQEAFLKAGGPKRDPKNLDPDGDGFACDWSPETYRKLVSN